MRYAEEFLEAGSKVIDLSPDFRFPDPKRYEKIYGKPHTAPALLMDAVYGATEINRNAVRTTMLVANPGCYALSCLSGLAPAVNLSLIDLAKDINIVAVNGTTGSSSSPMRETHHAVVANGMLAYSLEGHRHGPELEHHLQAMGCCSGQVIMSTSHGINLEDIKAPECFEIEQALIEQCDIPIFHDDQHGTAIVTAAGMLNALEIQGKSITEAKIVCLGAGSAAISDMRLLTTLSAAVAQAAVDSGVADLEYPAHYPL